MAIVLPVYADDTLVGSSILIGNEDGYPLFITTLHHLGGSKNFKILIPPHQGIVSAIQKYPVTELKALDVDLVNTSPIFDLALLKGKAKNNIAIPRLLKRLDEVSIGDEVYVVGYPFATLKSVLETANVTHISAKGTRLFMGKFEIPELILSHQTLQGSSGSAVIKKADGALCGMVRGTLAPPGVISIGDIPLGTDTNVTYVTFASVISDFLNP